MEDLKTAVDGFDITALIPSLEDLLGALVPLMRILVLVGPLVLLGLGLYYFFAAPREANHRAGYRFRYAMSRVGVWRFTQRLAGLVYGPLGLVLTIVMAVISIFFGGMEPPELVWVAAKCIVWQAALAGVATLAVNIIVIICYDGEGNLRKDFRDFKE
jgi:hypothetical protein